MSHSVDRTLLYGVLVLLFGGLLILASASVAISQKNFGSIGYYVLRQFIFGVLPGVTGLYIAYRIPYRFWKKISLPLMIFSLLLLALLFIPELSYSAGGARRWLHAGFFAFQPSEIMKFAFIAYLASWLDARREQAANISYGLIPFSLMLGVVGLFLVMQPDIGTLGVIVATAGILYFLGGGKVSQIATLLVFAVALLFFLIQLAPYRLARLIVFLNPGVDPQGIGYQINQALIAIGSGGFFGQGFGRGIQKYDYLPESMGDSIFAIFSEEVGFLGAIALIGIFAFLFFRGLAIAKKAPDVFGKLLAGGISVGMMTQAFVNMAAISGLLPLTGIPLPFISYGGTSLAVTLTSIGVLLNISKH